MTTNGSGLLELRDGRPLLDWIVEAGISHLNNSRAHPKRETNGRLMVLRDGLTDRQLRDVTARAREGSTRVRLSCVLLREAIADFDGVLAYLEYAASLGVDNVIFGQLMKTDPATVAPNSVVRYSDAQRVPLEPLLDRVSRDARFTFQRQIMGYYYYVEVWRYAGMDVVFEEADLAHLEATKRLQPGVVHELVFHPHGRLASTWQPWDGVLGPREPASLH